MKIADYEGQMAAMRIINFPTERELFLLRFVARWTLLTLKGKEKKTLKFSVLRNRIPVVLTARLFGF